MTPAPRAFTLVLAFLAVGSLVAAEPVSPESVVQHHLGLAALADGREAVASQRFEAACLANDGVGEACLRMGRARRTYRDGLQVVHARSFLDESLKARLLLVLRYDRSFFDPAVVKFDRLLPELSVDLDWHTQLPRLSANLGGTVKHNWYLNARTNAANSFRPHWEDVEDATPARNDQLEAEYYDVARGDFEWEVRLEAALALWRGAELALPYKHHQRHCNLDGAPHGPSVRHAPLFGYQQDVLSLELRQTF